jgi:peptidoglycan-N-acetylglucosamine deacetylase
MRKGMWYLLKTPFWLKLFYPQLKWNVKESEQKIYLTFDDGPVEGVTEYVLDQLAQYRARATFFCVGDNVRKFPHIYQRILREGHAVGNHTYHHLNGWKQNDSVYFDDISLCSRFMHDYKGKFEVSSLFRPPYGKVKMSQIREIRKHYEIVMWDVLTADFDPQFKAEDCLNKAIKNTQKGSIIVFHDSYKTEDKLKFMLPRYLEYFQNLGYTFAKL